MSIFVPINFVVFLTPVLVSEPTVQWLKPRFGEYHSDNLKNVLGPACSFSGTKSVF